MQIIYRKKKTTVPNGRLTQQYLRANSAVLAYIDSFLRVAFGTILAIFARKSREACALKLAIKK